MVAGRTRRRTQALATTIAALGMAGCGQALDGVIARSVSVPVERVAARDGAEAMADDPQVLMTRRVPATHADSVRAESIADSLRAGIARYRDVRDAVRAGYRPFPAVPDTSMRIIHYVHGSRSRREAKRLVPSEPGALLYERVSRGPAAADAAHDHARHGAHGSGAHHGGSQHGGAHHGGAQHGGATGPAPVASITGDSLRLVGAMFTAPATATLADLDARVPRSIVQWHMHRDVCVPRPVWDKAAWARRADDGRTLFGPGGTLVTEPACTAAGGRFLPTVFGWMAHVHVFAPDPADTWNAMYGHEHASGETQKHGGP